MQPMSLSLSTFDIRIGIFDGRFDLDIPKQIGLPTSDSRCRTVIFDFEGDLDLLTDSRGRRRKIQVCHLDSGLAVLCTTRRPLSQFLRVGSSRSWSRSSEGWRSSIADISKRQGFVQLIILSLRLLLRCLS
jgi:hypothetical protein